MSVHGGGSYLVTPTPDEAKAPGEVRAADFVAYDALGRVVSRFFRNGGSREGRVSLSLPASTLVSDGAWSECPADAKLYDRIVAEPVTPGYGQTELDGLATRLTEHGWRLTDSSIPAAYTYFAQFIAHDISKMRDEGDPCGPFNFRTSKLDLDSVFAPLPEGCDFDCSRHICAFGLAVGRDSGGAPEDLPRDMTGKPLIPDLRNDSNLALAQIHLAVIKLHQVIGDIVKDEEKAKCETIRHVQSVILQDFLPRITGIDPDHFAKGFKRKAVWPDGKGDFQIPIEFAAACFRFGHSMVRSEGYPWTTDGEIASATKLLALTGRREIGANTPHVLNARWRLLWDRMIQLQAPPVAEVNVADAIDTHFDLLLAEELRITDFSNPPTANELSLLLQGLGSEFSLMKVTFRRGKNVGLSSGQEVCKAMGLSIPDYSCLLTGLAGDLSACEEMIERTPLWFHVLAEARSTAGLLGPMAASVVIETLHAACAAAGARTLSIVADDGSVDFTPLEKLNTNGGDRFTLEDLIRTASVEWKGRFQHGSSDPGG